MAVKELQINGCHQAVGYNIHVVCSFLCLADKNVEITNINLLTVSPIKVSRGKVSDM